MQKKIPMRQCVGCREMKAKKELVRVVRSPEGEISLDFRGKAPARGAYVCPQAECLRRAIESKALERGLDCEAAIGSKGRRRPYLPPGTFLCFGQQMPVYLRAVYKGRAGGRTGLQCLCAVRVYRPRVCKIVS